MTDPSSEAVLLDQLSAEFDAVEQALSRLDDGSYGSCEVCGVAIDAETITVNPLGTRCPDHPHG